MKKEFHECDNKNCKRLSKDIYSEVVWIHISNGFGFSIHRGRNNNGTSHVKRFMRNDPTRKLDFCSIKCMLQWMYMAEETENIECDGSIEDENFYAEFNKIMVIYGDYKK